MILATAAVRPAAAFRLVLEKHSRRGIRPETRWKFKKG